MRVHLPHSVTRTMGKNVRKSRSETPQKFRIPLSIVFYKEDGEWVARCLEFDLVGAAKTKMRAARLLAEAIGSQLHASLKYNNPQNLFHPADGRYFSMFAAGKDAAVGELEITLHKLEEELDGGYDFDHVTAREYSGMVPCRQLVCT